MSTKVLGGICTHDEGCSKYFHGRGLCSLHYAQLLRSPDFVPAPQPKDIPPVCVCDEPQPDAIGECQRCFRPYRQETFAECRDAWRRHLGMDVSIAATARGADRVGPSARSTFAP